MTLDNHPRGGLLAPIPCKCGMLHASRGQQHAHVRKHPECRRTRAETRALYEARWPERRAASEARKQARRYETPEGRAKMAARQKVRRAVDTGVLVKTPCQVCGSVPVQGHHHNGYAVEHQLDVVWLCVDHHAAVHRELREEAA